MGHPPAPPYGLPAGAPPPPARRPGPLLFVLIAAAAAVSLAITGAVAYIVVTGDDDGFAPVASFGPVDLREPLVFRLVDEVSQPPCEAGALTADGDTACYTFGDDMLTVRRLEAIKAVAPGPASGGTGWSVQLTLTEADRPLFAALTGRAASGSALESAPASPSPSASPSASPPAGRRPGRQLGMLVGGTLISAPAVSEAITGGEVQIAGPAATFTRAYAEELVHRMTGR